MTKNSKRILKAITIIASVPLVIFMAIVAFCFVITVAVNLIYPSPEVPVIREAEFPFEIVYEQNGEISEIKDVYICKYNGVYTTAGGKSRSWKEYFKSGNENALIVYKDDATEVSINIGTARYYMDNSDHPQKNEAKKPSAYRVTEKDGMIYGEPLSDEKLYSEYGIKIISWNLPDPIENTFVPKMWYEFWK